MVKPIEVVTVAVLKKRLETIVDKVGLNFDQWSKLCIALLPEEFEPSSKTGKPTKLQPGPDRVTVYRERIRNGKTLFESRDFKPKD